MVKFSPCEKCRWKHCETVAKCYWPPMGRPPIHGVTMRKILVALDQATIDKAHDLGGGNLSAGLRKAVAQAPPVRDAVTQRDAEYGS